MDARQSLSSRSKMPVLKMIHSAFSIFHSSLFGRGKILLRLTLTFVGSLTFGLATAFAQVQDLSGNVVEPLKIQGDNAVVLIFLRTDCPISNRYAPEIQRLAERYSSEKLKFYLLYPGADETVEAIQQHQKEYGYKLEALRDPKHQLVKVTGVTVTPEVAVFRQGGWLYRGRIDNRFVAFGKMRPAPTIRDLEQVLAALQAGKPVKQRVTNAIGCFI